MICDKCETVAHCMKNGCVPKTNKKDEAMKLAMKALETERDNYQDWDKEDGAPEYIYEAITALQEALAEQPAQPVITIQQAYDMGAKGGEPTLEEKVLFEAWMQGHCWLVEGDWDGKTYVHKSERTGYLHPGAMLSRQLWAAWRDRAALSNQKEQS